MSEVKPRRRGSRSTLDALEKRPQQFSTCYLMISLILIKSPDNLLSQHCKRFYPKPEEQRRNITSLRQPFNKLHYLLPTSFSHSKERQNLLYGAPITSLTKRKV